MGKSLALKSNLSFDQFMRKLANVPKEKIDAALEQEKRESKGRRAKRGKPSPSGNNR